MPAHTGFRPPWPGRRTFGLLAVLLAAFVVWISLIPFDVTAVPLRDVPRLVVGVGQPLPLHLSRSDMLSNGLVFFALGFLLTGCVRLDRQRPGPFLALALVTVASGLLSVTVEFLQVFLPERTASLIDVASQTTGAALGSLTWNLLGRWLVELARGAASARERPSGWVRFLLLYAAALAVNRLYPFDFTTDLGDLAARVRNGQVVFVPFESLPPFPDSLAHVAVVALTAAPLGALAMLWGVAPGARRSAVWAVAGAGVFLALLELARALTMSHCADPGDVLLGAAGALLGAMAFAGGTRRELGRGSGSVSWWHWGATAAWGVVVVLDEWYPMDFRLTAPALREGLQRLTLLPFANYYRAAPAFALGDVLRKVLIAAPLGALMASALGGPQRGWSREIEAASVFLVAAVLYGALETGQLFLGSRIPDVTDVLVPATAAAGSAWLIGVLVPDRARAG